jgi:elongation factor Ts
MHIAAAYPPPQYIKPEDVPPEVIEREKEIYRHQAEQEGKPPHVIEKIVEGKLKTFFTQRACSSSPSSKTPRGRRPSKIS